MRIFSTVPAVVMPTNSEFCETCETVMMYVDSLLKENATEQDVEMLLEKICNFLPESARGEVSGIFRMKKKL